MAEGRRRGEPSARQDIARRVALLVAAGVLAATSLVGLVAWRQVRALERGRAAERQWVADVLAARLAAALRQRLEALSALTRSGPGLANGAASPREALRAMRFHARELAGVYVVQADGSILAEDPPGVAAATAPGTGLAHLDRPFVSEALRDGHVLLAASLRDPAGRPAGAAVAVIDPRSAAWKGLMGAPAAGHLVQVMDGRGALLGTASSAGGEPGRLTSLAPTAAAALVDGSTWRVVVRAADDPWLGGAAGFAARVAVAAAAVLALALLFAWGAARSVVEPLAALSRAAARMADGAIHEPIPDMGDDQVGRLGRSFEVMRQALARSQDDTERARGELERRVEERTLELQHLNRELRLRDQTRRRLLQKVIGAQEDERRRIARDLHDQTCQALAALGMGCEAALAAASPDDLRGGLAGARALAQRTLDEVHRVIFDLRPSVLDDLGLLPAIRWLAERHLGPQGIAVRCEFSGLDGRLPAETETVLFRAVQEAVVNVARHARAQNVLIQVARQEGAVQVEIEDDGQGFDVALLSAAEASGRGLGLLGMRERLELLGGTAEIDSAPALGARVVLRAPVEAASLPAPEVVHA